MWKTLVAAWALTACAWAAEPANASGTHAPGKDGPMHCRDDADRCAERHERFRQWCSGHEEACKAMKARMASVRDVCRQSPKECEEARRALREELREKMGKGAGQGTQNAT